MKRIKHFRIHKPCGPIHCLRAAFAMDSLFICDVTAAAGRGSSARQLGKNKKAAPVMSGGARRTEAVAAGRLRRFLVYFNVVVSASCIGMV